MKSTSILDDQIPPLIDLTELINEIDEKIIDLKQNGLNNILNKENRHLNDEEIKIEISNTYKDKIELQSEFDIVNIQKYYVSNNSPEHMTRIWLSNLNRLEKTSSYANYKFVKDAIDNIKSILIPVPEKDELPIINENQQSFNLKVPKNYNNIYSRSDILEKLYVKLVDNNVISGKKEDFINGFSGKPISRGIIWNIESNKRVTSKPTLLYFINELVNRNLIPQYQINDKIAYLFRDKEGKQFKNLNKVNTELKIQNKEPLDKALEEFFEELN